MNFAYREEVRPREALSVEHRQRARVRNDCAGSIALIALAIAVQSMRHGPPARGRHTRFWSWTVRMIEAPTLSAPLPPLPGCTLACERNALFMMP